MNIKVMMTEHVFYVKADSGEYNARCIYDGHAGREQWIVQSCTGSYISDDMRTSIIRTLQEKYNINGARKEKLKLAVPQPIDCPRCGHDSAMLRRDEGDDVIQSDCHCPKCGYYEYRNTDREISTATGVYRIESPQGFEWDTVTVPITDAYIKAFQDRVTDSQATKAYLAVWDKDKLTAVVGEYFE